MATVGIEIYLECIFHRILTERGTFFMISTTISTDDFVKPADVSVDETETDTKPGWHFLLKIIYQHDTIYIYLMHCVECDFNACYDSIVALGRCRHIISIGRSTYLNFEARWQRLEHWLQ